MDSLPQDILSDGNDTLALLPAETTIASGENQTLLPEPLLIEENATLVAANLSLSIIPDATLLVENGTSLCDPLTGANESYPYGLHDPPLNGSNLQGSAGSQYWEINQSGYYPIDWWTDLTQVLTTTNPYAILIQASNVVLDGMGLLINGTGTYGIYVDSGYENIQVNNFTVNDKGYGVYYDGVTYNESNTIGGDLATGGLAAPVPNVIEDVNANGNTYGIYVQNCANVTLINNTANQNTNTGISVQQSDNITLINNTANFNPYAFGYGIYLFKTVSSNLTNNNASYNANTGIRLEDSDNNNLSGNRMTNNTGNVGLWLEGSNDNVIFNNTLIGNNDGIYTAGSTNNIIDSNTVTGNTRYGMYFNTASNNNVFVNNRVSDHTVAGGAAVVMVNSQQNNLSFNTVTNNNKYAIYLSGSDSNELTGNTITSNTGLFGHGISLAASSDYNNITGNNTGNSNVSR